MQHPELKFFPAPPPTHPTIHLSAGNVLTAWSKELSDTPLLYLDESTMQWKPLPEVRDAG